MAVAGIALAGPARWSPPSWTLPPQSGSSSAPIAPTAEEVAPTGEPEPELPQASDIEFPLTLIAVTVALVILALVAYLVWRRLSGRRRASVRAARLDLTRDVVRDEPDVAPAVRRGIERALDILGEDREPADAVVQAWLGLEDAAAVSGAERRPTETPGEYAVRIVGRFDTDASAVAELLELYQGVRFGAHDADAASVDAARSALLRLRDAWHEGAESPR